MDPNFSFSSSSLGATQKPGLSRPPRLAKLRKPLTGHRPSFARPVSGTVPSQHNVGFGFGSGLHNSSQGFGFGSNDSFGSNKDCDAGNDSGVLCDDNSVVDEMRSLRIESEKAGSLDNVDLSGKGKVFGGGSDSIETVVSELPDEIRRLHIESERFDKLYGGNLGELPSKMKKLNVRDTNGEPIGDSSNSSVTNKMQGLRIQESLNESKNPKVDDASHPYEFQGGENSNKSIESDVDSGIMKNLTGLGVKNEMQSGAENLQDEQGKIFNAGKFNGIPGSFSSPFTFQAGSKSKNHVSLHHETTSTSKPLFASVGTNHNPVHESSNVDRIGKKVEFSFGSKLGTVGSGTQPAEFKTPDPKGSIIFGMQRKAETKRESAKETRSKNKKGKLKKASQVQSKFGRDRDYFFQEHSVENAESSGQYSPMDISPCGETLFGNSFSRETSVASEEESFHQDQNSSCGEAPNISNEIAAEGIAYATERLHVNDGDAMARAEETEESVYFVNEGDKVESPEEDTVSGVETESFKSATDELDCSNDSFFTAADVERSSASSIERQDSDGASHMKCDTSLTDTAQSGGFVFATSSVSVGEASASLSVLKKKTRTKAGIDPFKYPPNIGVSQKPSFLPSFQAHVSSNSSPEKEWKGNTSTIVNQRTEIPNQVREMETNKDSAMAASIIAQESCERWRLRGNQAYARGDFLKAEECYTQGVNCISQTEASRSCLRALMLCYSNRAATRMSIGRMREALDDCMKAASLDPSFLRVHVRAASCYLALGEVENSVHHFMKCLQVGSDACADRKLLVEASEGLEKAKKVAECMKDAVEFLGRKTNIDADSAIIPIDEALTISSHSKTLFQMKMDALLMLEKYEELIDFCEKIQGSIESNFLLSGVNGQAVDSHSSALKRDTSFVVWCWSVVLKSFFYLGKLDEALVFLEKQEESLSFVERTENKTRVSMIPLVGTIHDLLKYKAAGNEAYQSGKYAEAIDHYTAAISCSVESRPFAAICFCNRAAAYRSLSQIVDALADCSLAIALDENYFKALSRRAALYEMIRDYGQAVTDLEKLISLLTKKLDKMTSQYGTSDENHAIKCMNELNQARLKLSEMEEAAKKEISLDMYLILGVKSSASASEIKKAYRKAALKYHPDKAGQSLARSENSDSNIWKKITEMIHKDADRLFKMIGEAYAMLSDPSKRSHYDLEEQMRNTPNRGATNLNSNIYSDNHNYPYERTSSRRQWQEFRSSYGNSNKWADTNHYSWR